MPTSRNAQQDTREGRRQRIVTLLQRRVIKSQAELQDALARLPGGKFVYTNGSRKHAENVMARLGITALFDGIYDIVASGYRPKPEPAPYDDMIQVFGIDPGRAVMVEDIPRNLEPAHALGMSTVWIRTERHQPDAGDDDHVHHVADDLLEWLQKILPE